MAFELLDSLSIPGDPAKANEDAFAAESNAAAVFDGATGLGEMLLPGPSDAAWIAQFGARRLMAHLREGDAPNDALRHALADAEKSFNGLRRRPPKEKYEIPFASMMFVAAEEDGFEALWFGDCAALVLRPGEGVEIVGEAFDKRAAEARRVKLLAEAKGLAPAGDVTRAAVLPHLRAARNKVNTRARRLAVLARSARRRSRGSKRASPRPRARWCCYAPTASWRWPAITAPTMRKVWSKLPRAKGLAALGEKLRALEEADAEGRRFPRFKKSDDATAVLLQVALISAACAASACEPCQIILQRDEQHDEDAGIADPGIAVQQLGHQARRQAHQGDRQRQPDHQHPDVMHRRAGDRQHIVERHGDVGERQCERRRGAPPLCSSQGAGPLGGAPSVRQQLGGLMCLVFLADVAPQPPRHPQKQDAARDHQRDIFEQLHREDRQDDAQHDGGRQPQENHLAPVHRMHMGGRHADHDGVVARQHQVDQDHLKQREEPAVRENIEQCVSSRVAVRRLLRPARLRRQGHQDGLGIAAGLQAELGAAVVEQVELHIAAAAHQLVGLVGVRPASSHVPSDDVGIDVQKCESHRLGEGEIPLPVAGVQPVVEDAAHAARLAAVRQEEVLVAPLLEARVIGGVEAVAGRFEGGMEVGGVLRRRASSASDRRRRRTSSWP